MSLLLLIVLILLLVGALPNFGYHSYGYAPSGLSGVLVIVLLVLPHRPTLKGPGPALTDRELEQRAESGHLSAFSHSASELL